MLQKILEARVGILFDQEALYAFQSEYTSAFVQDKSTILNKNVKGPVIDDLWRFDSLFHTLMTFFWWFLEFVPFPRSYQDAKTHRWHRSYM